MNIQFLSFAMTCLFVCLSSQAQAWGRTGHEVVCEIAYQELTPAARSEVNALMRLDPEFRLFSRSCTWPDAPRKRGREHYVNLPRDQANFADDPCPVARNCVVTAILNDMNDLALGSSAQTRLEALKYLGHWVGDVHQPIHVSFSDDRGGNNMLVGAPCFGKFHALWDNCILESRLGEDAPVVAEELLAEITDALRSEWVSDDVSLATVISWAQESLDISRDPDVGYCIMNGNSCWYSETSEEYDEAEDARRVDAPNSYLDQHEETIRLRLMQAGVRLGHILNVILDDGSSGPSAITLNSLAAQGVVMRQMNAPSAGVQAASPEQLERIERLLIELLEEVRAPQQ